MVRNWFELLAKRMEVKEWIQDIVWMEDMSWVLIRCEKDKEKSNKIELWNFLSITRSMFQN